MRGRIGELLVCSLLQVGCTCSEERPSGPTSQNPMSAEGSAHDASLRDRGMVGPASKAKESELARARTLLELPESAYGNRLYRDGDGFLLLTRSEVIRVSPSSEVHRVAASLGPEAVRLGQHQILFFREGRLRRASLSGDAESPVVELPSAPYMLISAGDNLAWVLRSQSGYLVQTLRDDNVITVYETTRRIGAATLWGDRVYLLESSHGSWRVVGASLGESAAYLQEPRQGRPPSMLLATDTGVYLYAGLKEGIERLSLDLQTTHTLATNVTCSPFAISDRLVCAQVGGLIQVTETAKPRIVAIERDGPIAAVAATNHGTAWLVDSGKDHLKLKFTPLPPLPDGTPPP